VITGSSIDDGSGMLYVLGATGNCGSREGVVKSCIYNISACDYINIPPGLSSVFPALVGRASIHNVGPSCPIFMSFRFCSASGAIMPLPYPIAVRPTVSPDSQVQRPVVIGGIVAFSARWCRLVVLGSGEDGIRRCQ
jgi:hypothetical protein